MTIGLSLNIKDRDFYVRQLRDIFPGVTINDGDNPDIYIMDWHNMYIVETTDYSDKISPKKFNRWSEVESYIKILCPKYLQEFVDND